MLEWVRVPLLLAMIPAFDFAIQAMWWNINMGLLVRMVSWVVPLLIVWVAGRVGQEVSASGAARTPNQTLDQTADRIQRTGKPMVRR